jgi:hypothetical protein
LERLRRELQRSWKRLEVERAALEREKRAWFEDGPRPSSKIRPFCFVEYRMKRRWRDQDRSADISGLTVNETIGSTNARRAWFRLLDAVIAQDQVIRVRHRHHDEPAILLRESRFRSLETLASAYSKDLAGAAESMPTN